MLIGALKCYLENGFSGEKKKKKNLKIGLIIHEMNTV